MAGLTVTLLFSKDKNKEPPGILQCDTSGEYFPFYFYDWRDVIHYIQWTNDNFIKKDKKYNETKLYEEWSKKYGYDDEEEFTGDLNEFRCDKNDPNKWTVFTTLKNIDGSKNLNKISVWK